MAIIDDDKDDDKVDTTEESKGAKPVCGYVNIGKFRWHLRSWKDAFEELINAVNTMTITDENTFEVTFECKNCVNILKYEVNSQFHFLKHTKIFKSKNLSVEIVIIILNK